MLDEAAPEMKDEIAILESLIEGQTDLVEAQREMLEREIAKLNELRQTLALKRQLYAARSNRTNLTALTTPALYCSRL